jgi:hypothetical protein
MWEVSEGSEEILSSPPSQDPLLSAGREGIDVEVEEQAYVQISPFDMSIRYPQSRSTAR